MRDRFDEMKPLLRTRANRTKICFIGSACTREMDSLWWRASANRCSVAILISFGDKFSISWRAHIHSSATLSDLALSRDAVRRQLELQRTAPRTPFCRSSLLSTIERRRRRRRRSRFLSYALWSHLEQLKCITVSLNAHNAILFAFLSLLHF